MAFGDRGMRPFPRETYPKDAAKDAKPLTADDVRRIAREEINAWLRKVQVR
jgi:hypothetical protein